VEDLRRGGSTWRFLQDNCFMYLMLIAAVIGFAALARKVRRDAAAARLLMEADERESETGAPAAEDWLGDGPPHDEPVGPGPAGDDDGAGR
jgi:hypothetical protein